jgi:hypothetical protein
MKKIYYSLVFVVLAFTACQKQPVVGPTAYTKSMSITLATTDYTILDTSIYANKSHNFKVAADAKLYIPTILNSKYAQLDNGSTANVTYALAAPTIKLADSLSANVAYTVTAADYAASSSVTGTTYKDYSDTQVLLFLTYKYPNPAANQLALLTYTYYLSGVTPSAGALVTDSFLYLNGEWQKVYTVSAAQYASVGRGNFSRFTASDVVNLPVYFNSFLKADITVTASAAKAGDIKYVSYTYYSGVAYQKVLLLTFDGTNWVTVTTNTVMSFVKKGGTWVADNTVYLTFGAAEFKIVGNSDAGTTAARANFAKYGDFNISATTDATYWSPADINNAIIAILKSEYPTAATGQVFNVTYATYHSGTNANVTQTYIYDGSTFALSISK